MREVQQFIYEEIDGEMKAVLNPVWKRINAKKLYEYELNKSGIPPFYFDIEFKDYRGDKTTTEFKQVVYYAKNLKNEEFAHTHLYLFGLRSVQKTALSANILKEGIRQGLKVKFVSAGELMDMLMKTQGFSADPIIQARIDSLKNADVLCLDDIFDPNKSLLWKNSENKNMQIAEYDIFLREVISSNTKLIVTSNFKMDAIEQYYGEDIFELIDRNFVLLEFKESVKSLRKENIKNVLDLPSDFDIDELMGE